MFTFVCWSSGDALQDELIHVLRLLVGSVVGAVVGGRWFQILVLLRLLSAQVPTNLLVNV